MMRGHYEGWFQYAIVFAELLTELLSVPSLSFFYVTSSPAVTDLHVFFFFFQTPSEPWSSSSSTGPSLTTDSRTRAGPSKASWSKTSSCISPWTESLTSSRVSSSTLCSVRICFTLTPSNCSYTRFFFFWSMLIPSNLSAGQLIERIAVLLSLNLPHLFSSEKIWQATSCFCFGERMFF